MAEFRIAVSDKVMSWFGAKLTATCKEIFIVFVEDSHVCLLRGPGHVFDG